MAMDIRRWLVLVLASSCYLILGGTLQSYGVILTDLTRDLGVSTGFAGTIMGLSIGIMYLLNPLNTPLLKHTSARKCVMIGGFVGSLSLASAGLARNGVDMAVSFSLNGVCFSTMSFQVIACCADYFPRSFKLAVGCVLTCCGLGYILFPMFAEVILLQYGWRGTLFIFGALNAHAVVFGALLKPPKQCKQHRQNIIKVSILQDDDEGSETTRKPDGRVERPNGKTSGVHDGSGDRHHVDGFSPESSRDHGDACERSDTEMTTQLNQEFADRQGTIVSEIAIPEVETSLVRTETLDNQPNIRRPASQILPCGYITFLFRSFLKEIDLYLYRDFPKVFLPVSCLNSITGISYSVVLFVTPNGLAKGLDLSDAVYLATIANIGALIGRFSTSIITSRGWVRIETYIFIVATVGGASCFFNIVANSFWLLSILSWIKGFSVGMELAVFPMFIQEYLPPDRHKSALSICHFWLGIGYLLGGAIQGFIFDATGSYNVAFCVAGVIEVLTGLIVKLPFLLCTGNHQSREHEHSKL